MSKEFVIIGGGQLGSELAKKYPDALAVDYPEIDITKPESLDKIDWSDKTTILNAAAMTAVDDAQIPANCEKVFDINTYGVRNLAEIAIKHGLHMIHVSSDYVFDGTHANHPEDETFSPMNVYGISKMLGDKEAAKAKRYHIIRTSWVVGDGNNFIKTMFGLAQRDIKPSVVNDQFGRLTFTSELVRAIDHIIRNEIAYGTYNVSNSGPIKSWDEIAADVYELAGHSRDEVTGVSTMEYYAGKKNIAPRPENSDLNLSKIQATGFESHDYPQLVEEYVDKLKESL